MFHTGSSTSLTPGTNSIGHWLGTTYEHSRHLGDGVQERNDHAQEFVREEQQVTAVIEFYLLSALLFFNLPKLPGHHLEIKTISISRLSSIKIIIACRSCLFFITTYFCQAQS
jgi:hypothetical protein